MPRSAARDGLAALSGPGNAFRLALTCRPFTHPWRRRQTHYELTPPIAIASITDELTPPNAIASITDSDANSVEARATQLKQGEASCIHREPLEVHHRLFVWRYEVEVVELHCLRWRHLADELPNAIAPITDELTPPTLAPSSVATRVDSVGSKGRPSRCKEMASEAKPTLSAILRRKSSTVSCAKRLSS